MEILRVMRGDFGFRGNVAVTFGLFCFSWVLISGYRLNLGLQFVFGESVEEFPDLVGVE